MPLAERRHAYRRQSSCGRATSITGSLWRGPFMGRTGRASAPSSEGPSIVAWAAALRLTVSPALAAWPTSAQFRDFGGRVVPAFEQPHVWPRMDTR